MNISNIFLIFVLGAYSLFSKILFDNVYNSSKVIIDEEFHLPLGEEYCNFRFDKWDSKVTTLPGLYLFSALLLGPFNLCSIYWLRAVSLLLSCINLILFYLFFSYIIKSKWQRVFSALTVTLLPPLYFFSHVYYTDIASLTTNLLFIILSERGYHYSASLAGFFSILCRQTNVIFVAIYGGKYIINELYALWIPKQQFAKKEVTLPAKDLPRFVADCIWNPLKILKNMSFRVWLNCSCYISLIIFFVAFVILNGGIVVGDKTAHQVSVNIPQLFYFSLFCLAFGWPHFVGEVSNFLMFVKQHKSLVLMLSLVVVFVVHFNTVVHPYLLADNRHFVFYIWNRFYGKYWWFKYSMTPVYIFSFYTIFKLIWDKSDISFFLFYIPGIVFLLTTQSLLEFRYFLVPYIILRLKVKSKDSSVFNVALEFITYFLINVMTFKVFFTKTVSWIDYQDPQRIIW